MTRRTAGSLALLALAACGPSYVPPPQLEAPPSAPTTVALDEGLDTPPERAPRDTSTPVPWMASFVQKIDEKYFREFDATLLAPTGEIVTVGRGRLRVHGPDGAPLRSASVPRAAAIGFTRRDQLTLVHEGGLLHFSWPGMVRTTTKIDDEIRAASIVGRRIALSLGDVFSEHRRVRVINMDGVVNGEATRAAAEGRVMEYLDAEGVTFENIDAALSEPGTQVRLFGKPVAYEKRRMGVAIAHAETIEAAREKAVRSARAVKVVKR